MTTQICIQDPDFQASVSLHEALNQAGKGATYAAGAYAFVSKGGVDLLMGSPSFSEMLGNAPIQLVVGMDAITNEAAVASLSQLQSHHPGLEILAFVHDKKGSIFHPKVCWFKNSHGGAVVTGSGNLTVGGLRKNREIFSVSEVDADGINSVEQNWNSWIESNRNNLYTLDSKEVAERAALNNIRRAAFLDDLETSELSEQVPLQNLAPANASNAIHEEDIQDWSFNSNASFLVAEIPKSGPRWKQANFTLDTFVNFFGGIRGDNSKRLVLRAIYESGESGPLEDRPCVTVASDNFRVELHAASGLDYPAEGRPIGVFVRVSLRMFAYYLSMPGTSRHTLLTTWLNEKAKVGRNVRRVTSTIGNSPDLIKALPLGKLLK